MNYFLAKTEPGTYSIENLGREPHGFWDGVKNPQALRASREMRPADSVSLEPLRVFSNNSLERAFNVISVSPIMRASKYSMTSFMRLKRERCASSKTSRSKNAGLNCS
jgi:hypothetical protein